MKIVETAVGKPALKNEMEAHSAELPETFANTSHAQRELDYEPKVGIEEGVQKFVEWYKWYQRALEAKTFPAKEIYLPDLPADGES